MDLLLGFSILQLIASLTGVMHEADDTCSIRRTLLCDWLDQVLTLALNTWILLKFSIFHWISLFILLILVDVELPLHIVVTLSWNAMLECWNTQAEYKTVLFYFCQWDGFLCWWIRGLQGNLKSCIFQRLYISQFRLL